MKRILLVMMLSIGVLGFAQSVEEVVKEQIVNKIKGYKLTDLVPYSKDGKKWALMDVKSRKILTDFVLNRSTTFDSTLYININIGERQKELRIYSDYTFSIMIEGMNRSLGTREEPIKTDTPGFQMDEYGKIISYHADYKYISNPILYKGDYYIVAYKKDNSEVLINERGEEKMEFRFKKILSIGYKDKKSGEDVFYVKDFEGKRGFVTMSGKKKLYGKLLSGIYYPILGYSLQKDGFYSNEIKKSGVVDLMTQKWLIKPQEKYKIYDIIYTSSEEIDDRKIENRNKATVYFLATDQSGQRFVLDINGNPILPKN